MIFTTVTKMMTHHPVMTSSLDIKNLIRIDKFDVFTSHIDYNSKTDIFGDTTLIIDQC